MERIHSFDAVVVGTGAAGYHAACRLRQAGKNIAIVTEKISCGTSRNAGSDKQTYYKLGLGGDSPDSVRALAQDLFSGGAVDGDNALCEAALSSRCFLNLCELGVPFPCNAYGEYIGYKTDHDPHARATSAGPLTSKIMTEMLEKRAFQLSIPIFDELLAIEILKNAAGVCGLLCLDQTSGEFELFRSGNIVLATGGPAGIYQDSVYPIGHSGSTGLAIEAGASLQNMTEWQYGLASLHPRWNVSGTYMQVLPRFLSVDPEGNEREFLLDYFKDPYLALSAVFLKGYQWPFDSRKVPEGSSVIDLLVYRESVLRKRRVFLDYRTNPFGLEALDFQKLSKEAFSYLTAAGACFGTPLERLAQMNQPAVDLYLSKGLDLSREMLEIALCAQHCNGGISVDSHWQTTVPGLFAAGECAGTHGISRPGGSALNAGQVGSLRAAQYISLHDRPIPENSEFLSTAREALTRHKRWVQCWLSNGSCTVEAEILHARKSMSAHCAAIRNPEDMAAVLSEVQHKLSALKTIGISNRDQLGKVYRLRDLLLTQQAMLTACLDFFKALGVSRGSALYTGTDGCLLVGSENRYADRIQQIYLEDGEFHTCWRPVRPIPESTDCFEAVWKQFRQESVQS